MRKKQDGRKANGGARAGTGPKLKYGEPTVSFGPIRLPQSKKEEIKSLIAAILKRYEVKK